MCVYVCVCVCVCIVRARTGLQSGVSQLPSTGAGRRAERLLLLVPPALALSPRMQPPPLHPHSSTAQRGVQPRRLHPIRTPQHPRRAGRLSIHVPGAAAGWQHVAAELVFPRRPGVANVLLMCC